MANGIRTEALPSSSLAQSVLINSETGTGKISFADFSRQLSSMGAMSDRVAAFEAVATVGGLSYLDFSFDALAARSGTVDGEFAVVVSSGNDAGIYKRVAGVWTFYAELPAVLRRDLIAEQVDAAKDETLAARDAATLAEAAAGTSAAMAQQSRDQSVAAAQVAGAPIYPDTTAGLAGEAEGDPFLVPDQSGLLIYVKTGGAADPQGRLGELWFDTVAEFLAYDGSAVPVGTHARTRDRVGVYLRVADGTGHVPLGSPDWEVVHAEDVRAWGVTLDSSAAATANAAAINAASAAGDVDFPAGVIYFNGTISGLFGAWRGKGRGGTYSSSGDYATYLYAVGDNNGDAFIDPPLMFSGFHVYGDSLQGIGIRLGAEGTFASRRRWEDITVRGFGLGIEAHSFFSIDWRQMHINGCTKGIKITPVDTAADDGYFTDTLWTSLSVSDCPEYGLYIHPPLGASTFTWRNVVVERCGAGGSAQCHLGNITLKGDGVYLEGSSGVPAIKAVASVTLMGDWWYVNGTGGIDCNNQTVVLSVDKMNMTSATDVISNVNSNCRISLKNAAIETDLRGSAGMSELDQVTMRSVGVTVAHRRKTIGVGKAPATSNQTHEAKLLYFGKKTWSGTITAGSKVQIVTNKYYPSIMSNAVGTATLVNQYQRDLRAQVLPASTGNASYFCVDVHNVGTADITLTAADFVVMIWQADSPEAL